MTALEATTWSSNSAKAKALLSPHHRNYHGERESLILFHQHCAYIQLARLVSLRSCKLGAQYLASTFVAKRQSESFDAVRLWPRGLLGFDVGIVDNDSSGDLDH
jgi:hypothetical protein